MAEEILARQREVSLYVKHAQEMLETARHNLDGGFYASAVNRAYYAIFYAANALLSTKGLARGKHSVVISAFRQHFIKTGLLDVEYSRTYGQIMDARHIGDYDIYETIEIENVNVSLIDAQRFVDRVKIYLKQDGWL